MKKTLSILLSLYLIAIAVGLFVHRGLRSQEERSSYAQAIKLRKQEILETGFLIKNNEENPQFSLDVLKITNYVLTIEDARVGGGALAEAGDVITVHYRAMFEDGTIFDSSRNPGRSPFQFKLGAGQAVAGWDQGIPGMRVGGVRTLNVPPASGYGMNDYGPIPGGSTLRYEIELLSVFK